MPAVIPIQAQAAGDATQFFRNYTQRESRVPMPLWWAARALALAVALGLVVLLFVRPGLGLTLFWGLVIPLVPALLVVAPGLWRQVCPMATLNQLPRLLGRSRGLDLPGWAKTSAFAIAVGLLLLAVALRQPLLNHQGPVLGLLVLVMLAAALAGGLVFKGRSGWCGTFCPLAPVQRVYGQAPLFVVRNGYCNPCVGCQKSCYDFNPRAAVFSDVYDEDPRHAAQRRLFMGLLPGLILGYFVPQALQWGLGPLAQAGALLAGAAASAGLSMLLVAFLPANPYRVALAFGVAALVCFYFFAGPLIVRTVAALLGTEAAPGLVHAARGSGAVLAIALAASGLWAESRWRAVRRAKGQSDDAGGAASAVAGGGTSLKQRLAAHDGAGTSEITDRASRISFQAAPDATLLEAIESAGLKINFGCRAGVCGADPIAICEGHESLLPAGSDEQATLARLGFDAAGGRVRLACMACVKPGSAARVLIDRDPHSAPAAAAPAEAAPMIDRALAAGLARVVIVGNGVAGMGVAEGLRRASASVAIDVVSHEPHAFYNRMGIGRLVYDSAGMESLALVPEDWPARQRITVHRGTVAAAIDREARTLRLADGRVLPYDKLVLATGARSTPPDATFLNHPNAFVLRSADDARQLRDYALRRNARRALVLGGGVLGVEAADALHHLGLKVTLLQRADRLMNAQLDEPGGARLSAYLESIGIQVVTQVSVARWEADPSGRQLVAAWLSHGPRVRADLFVAALGIQANSFLAEKAGLTLGDNGVAVDRFMQTSDPHILAVGDVAALKGTPRGLWPIGAAHAASAVETLLGERVPYATPRFVLQLKCEGIDLRSLGEIAAREGDEEFHAREGSEAWWRLVLRSGMLVGGLYVGPPGTAKAFTRLLQQPVDLAPLRPALRAGSLEGLKELVR